jgi:hypothetical protein
MSARRLRTACNKGGRTLDTLVLLGQLTLLAERTCSEFPGWVPDANASKRYRLDKRKWLNRLAIHRVPNHLRQRMAPASALAWRS